MTHQDALAAPASNAEFTPARASVTLLERLAEKLGGRASVAAVFGEPVFREGITVVPVARVGFGFGGGAGREKAGEKDGEGGGGGGGAGAKPLGFIEIKDGAATYKPIRDPWVDVALPLATLLISTLGAKAVRAAVAARPRRRTAG
ncbi:MULTISPECIES: spore germination protein GerW family protein [unclassified Streptomyces]|uniref:spore germination protein GerW family protein n=1 Tax=unclassified Streptomyces TaxID=2593676 RepID=UPI00278C86E9|nr:MULTISPECIES: spore germination protein GerW family protein [unclassified Streptomyces]